MRVVAFLLAAGSSSRFGDDKLLAPYKGKALIEHALDALAASPLLEEILVVVRPGFAAPAWRPELGAGVRRPRCRVVVNPDHAEGMGSSLRAGVAAAPDDADAYLIALADMPEVTPELIASLIACYQKAGKSIVIPVWHGRRGHPVMIGAELREMLLRVTGDVGAREIIAEHPDRVGHFDTDDEAVVFDVDAPGDLGWAGRRREPRASADRKPGGRVE